MKLNHETVTNELKNGMRIPTLNNNLESGFCFLGARNNLLCGCCHERSPEIEGPKKRTRIVRVDHGARGGPRGRGRGRGRGASWLWAQALGSLGSPILAQLESIYDHDKQTEFNKVVMCFFVSH